jgi:uncharacterized membrane protein
VNKKLIIAIAALIFLTASVLASCVELSADDTVIEVPQYEIRNVDFTVHQLCRGDVKLSVDGDFVSLSDSDMVIPQGDKEEASLMLHPGAAEPGMYAVTVHSNDDSLAFAVRVTESDADPLMLVFPVIMTASADEPVELEFDIRNDGTRQLNNIVVFLEESDERTYHEELLSLSPGDKKTLSFDLGTRQKGDYRIEVTALSGDFIKKRMLNLEVGDEGGPASVSISVDSYKEDGYSITYTVRNEDSVTLQDLFVTIEDAPLGWDVRSPSSFDLSPGESRDIELLVIPDGNPDTNVTLALYKGPVLLREDYVELSRRVLHGTGLITFGESLGFGLALLAAFIASYLVYLKRDEIESGEFAPWSNVFDKVRGLIP